MHNFINQYLISVVSYMFRTSWVHPQGDSCICSMVCFTRIGVSILVDRTMCLPEDESTSFETYKKQWKLTL